MAIKTEKLDFSSLAQIDNGKVDTLLRVHLARIAQDCMDRPGDKTERKVTLEFLCEPILDDDGGCDYVKLKLNCASKLPVYKTREYEMRVSKGGFLFNVDAPDAIDQHPLFPGAVE